MLKQLGRWKSSSIAEGYVENSMRNREKIYESIIHQTMPNPQSKPQPSTSKNCSIEVITTNEDEDSTHANPKRDDFSDNFEFKYEDIAAIEKLAEVKVPESSTPSFTTGRKKVLAVCNVQSIRPGHSINMPPISVFSKISEIETPISVLSERTENIPSNSNFPKGSENESSISVISKRSEDVPLISLFSRRSENQSPTSVLSKGSKDEPPIKKSKLEQAKTRANQQPCKYLRTTSAMNDGPLIPVVPRGSENQSPISGLSKRSKDEPPIRRSEIEEAKTQTNQQPCKSLPTTSSMNDRPGDNYENCVFHGNLIYNFYYSNIDDESSGKKMCIKKAS